MNITLNKIKKKYGNRTVLDVEYLRFESGKLYALLGPNGSGKSTLLRLIAGMDSPDSGQILYDGDKAFPHKDISYQPQNPYMFDLSVQNNLFLGMGKRSGRELEADQVLDKLAMKNFVKMRASSLSGGETQRIVLARTLSLHRKIVLLDEPASAEDIHGSHLIENHIQGTCEQDGSTVLFSTHNPSQALRIADEVIFLWEGRAVEHGKPDAVLHSPQSEEVRSFLQYWIT
jgi:ABC-type multidrug transport system ATPase subunit